MTESPFVNAGYNPDVRPDAEERAETPRDGYGRYMMPRPGMEHTKAPAVASTRVSTVKSAGINRKGLEIWGKRVVTRGFLRDIDPQGPIVQVPGAELLIAALKVLDDSQKRELDAVVAEAYNRGGGKSRSSLGTAVHEFTERRNRGEDLPIESAPPEHQVDIRAYDAALERFGVHIIPELLERIVNCPWSIQGTADNIVWFQNPHVVPEDAPDGEGVPGELEMRVADLKTGRDLSLGWGEILIQLWLYANATHIWDAETKRWGPMPRELRKDRGLIFHVPMDGTATVYDVDLSGIGDVVAAAMVLRRHHGEAALKVTALGTVDMRGPAYVTPITASNTAPMSGSMVVTEPDPFTPDLDAPERSFVPELTEPAPSVAVQIARDTVTALREAKALTAPLDKAKDGSPLGPIKGPGERGCSACNRRGHKAGSPKCWGDQDPAKLSGTTDARSHMPDNAPGQMPDATDFVTSYADQELDRLNAESQMPDATYLIHTEPGDVDLVTDPRCPGHPGAGWTNRGDGVFVCGECGLRSAAVPTTLEQAGPELSVPPATVTEPWPTDWVLTDIQNAQTATAVRNVRALALNKGAWNPELHDGPGLSRYEQLTKDGKL